MKRRFGARSATVGSGALSVGATVLLAAVPKCPACITATSAILGALGLGATELAWVRAICLVVFVLSLGTLIARRRRRAATATCHCRDPATPGRQVRRRAQREQARSR